MFDRRRFADRSVPLDVATRLDHSLPTTGRVGERGLLRLGAALGLVGWTGTAILARLDAPAAGHLALGWWTLPVAGMVYAIGRHAANPVRFSTPLFGWGVLNGTATTVTLWAVAVDAPTGTIPLVWLADLALGYAWTAVALGRAGQPGRTRGYATAALACAVAVGLGYTGVTGGDVGGYPVVATLHVVPLALDARGLGRRRA
ncbi:hypothetical protein [Halorientalis regularis]|uniref:hypothetical protein n=1 Tax=Halorientalis regularis TaxID=660518 RepID=UPI000B861ADB|nr:hypothetical protein [Halorientalis regularis]